MTQQNLAFGELSDQFIIAKRTATAMKKVGTKGQNVFKLSKEFLNRNFQRIASKLYHTRG